MSTEQTRIILY